MGCSLLKQYQYEHTSDIQKLQLASASVTPAEERHILCREGNQGTNTNVSTHLVFSPIWDKARSNQHKIPNNLVYIIFCYLAEMRLFSAQGIHQCSSACVGITRKQVLNYQLRLHPDKDSTVNLRQQSPVQHHWFHTKYLWSMLLSYHQAVRLSLRKVSCTHSSAGPGITQRTVHIIKIKASCYSLELLKQVKKYLNRTSVKRVL